jgi:hypothetical protein
MSDLVQRLSKKTYSVIANRPDTSVSALKRRIELKFLHILFEETGTEIGIRLDLRNCDLSKADFDNEKGLIHIEGAMTLNYEKVRCIADINIETMQGQGQLRIIENEAEYNAIINGT